MKVCGYDIFGANAHYYSNSKIISKRHAVHSVSLGRLFLRGKYLNVQRELAINLYKEFANKS